MIEIEPEKESYPGSLGRKTGGNLGSMPILFLKQQGKSSKGKIGSVKVGVGNLFWPEKALRKGYEKRRRKVVNRKELLENEGRSSR